MGDDGLRLLELTNDELGFLIACVEARCVDAWAVTARGRAFGARLQRRLERLWTAPDDDPAQEAVNDAVADASSARQAELERRREATCRPTVSPDQVPVRGWLQAVQFG